jgi:hypothetical protein
MTPTDSKTHPDVSLFQTEYFTMNNSSCFVPRVHYTSSMSFQPSLSYYYNCRYVDIKSQSLKDYVTMNIE